MATLNQRLDQWRWVFFEKGLQHIYDELKAFAIATPTAGPTGFGSYGIIDLQLNCVPPVVSKANNAGQSGAPPTLIQT